MPPKREPSFRAPVRLLVILATTHCAEAPTLAPPRPILSPPPLAPLLALPPRPGPRGLVPSFLPPSIGRSDPEASFPDVEVTQSEARGSMPNLRTSTLGILSLGAGNELGLRIVLKAVHAGVTRVIDLGRASDVQVTISGQGQPAYQASLARLLPLFKPARVDYVLLLHEFTSSQGRKTVDVHGVVNPLELDDYQGKYEAYGKAVLERHRAYRTVLHEWVAKCQPVLERYRADKQRMPQFASQMNRYLAIAEEELEAMAAWLDGAESSTDALIREQTHGRLVSPDALVEQARRYRASATVAYIEATLLATMIDTATGETLWAGRFSKQHPTATGAVEAVVDRLVKTLLKGTSGVKVPGM